jgi:acetyl esterase/lipase
MLRFSIFLSLFLIALPLAAAEPEIELWPAGMPEPKVQTDKPEEAPVDAKGISRRSNISKPRLVVFEAPEALRTGAAAVVVPGGGLAKLADSHEGSDACRRLNKLGITCFLLLHRSPTNKHPQPNLGPAQDAQRALQLVRSQAEKWKLDPKKIGIFGYSSGGQVTLVASTNDLLFPKDETVTTSHKPDFVIVSYPWQIYDQEAKQLRSDIHPEYGLPPTFIAQCADDKSSLAQGSTLLFLECLNRKVPAELHVYEKGGHGYGMQIRPDAPGTTDWGNRLEDWLVGRKLGKKPME